ncbi:MAG: putative sulfate exporter family transporter [Pirellulales bacterium]|nr:putative sulfate exporter family transporter [Pirellulales bacterium]
MEPPDAPTAAEIEDIAIANRSPWRSEDVWAIWLGWGVLLVALGATWLATPSPVSVTAASAATAVNPLAPWVRELGEWTSNLLDAFRNKSGASVLPGVAGAFVAVLLLFSMGLAGIGERVRGFPLALLAVFLLAVFAYLLAGQKVVKHYNLEYALWALVTGLIISNTVGRPAFMRPAVRTEFYIKTGLVLLGAEVLINRLLALGLPGVFISWVVPPTVLILTYLFGQYVLRIPSRSLNMVISADMSVCGVSAAIATAAACKAKKEELSLAVGLSLAFTAGMMVVMPAVIKALGMGPVLGGAWIGGTIDSTGAVAAAGGMLGAPGSADSEIALTVAVTIKMIQNILIGAVAFGVAVYWVTCVERTPGGQRPSLMEIWRRFPKFVLGFLAASLLFSYLESSGGEGEAIASAATATSKTLRSWLFCLAFVSIGLETNFRELRQYMVGGKPLILYVCGQTLNLALTLLMAWLMFTKVFPDAATALAQ